MRNLLLLLLLLVLLSLALSKEIEKQRQQFADIEVPLEKVEPQADVIDGKSISQHMKVVDADGNGDISLEQHTNFFRKQVIQDDSEDWGEYIQDFYWYLDSNKDKEVSSEEFKLFFEGPAKEESGSMDFQLPMSDQNYQAGFADEQMNELENQMEL